LGWIGNKEALEYLIEAANSPDPPEGIIDGLADSGHREALDALKELEKSTENKQSINFPFYLHFSEERVEREEGLERARNIRRNGTEDLQKFWNSQSPRTSEDPAAEIIGEYIGTVYWARSRARIRGLDGIRIIFREDGVFETNLDALTDMKRLRIPSGDSSVNYGPIVKSLDSPTSSPSEAKAEFSQGRYRVLSPTQLILAPSRGVTTYGFSLSGGRLSFYHWRLKAFFSLSKNTSDPPSFTGKDIAGVYKGSAMIVGGEHGARTLRESGEMEIAFTDNGFFSMNFGDEYFRTTSLPKRLTGKYLIDSFGTLVCFSQIQFSFDHFGGGTDTLFNWHARKGALHLNAPGGMFAFSLSASPVNLQDPDMLETLTSGPYVGSAFRSTPGGGIVEIPDVELQFSKDGSWSGFPSKALGASFIDYPTDGRFAILSDRQLYMASRYESGGLSNEEVCDVLVSGDKLFFTSLNQHACFVLKKKIQ
jgi:hypothetical protein